MDGRVFDTIAKAAATGASRRQVLRGLLATAGGGALVHLGGDESAARNRCCRRKKRETKQTCKDITNGACPKLDGFSCEKTAPGTCEVISFDCVNKDGRSCFL